MLEESHEEAFQKTDKFYGILINLRYEGKPSLGKNLREAAGVLKFFHGEHMRHTELEEHVLFPFVKTHVPKNLPSERNHTLQGVIASAVTEQHHI